MNLISFLTISGCEGGGGEGVGGEGSPPCVEFAALEASFLACIITAVRRAATDTITAAITTPKLSSTHDLNLS